MERLTIPDVRVDEHTTRRSVIDVLAVREHAMKIYWRLKAYEDIAELCGGFDRLRELAEADKDGRVSVLPCKPGADMINKILPGSTYLMERVHFAVAYVNKGNIYLMTQRTFEGGVKNGAIVSAATERAMEEMEGK